MKKTKILLKPWLTEFLIIAQCFWFIVLTTECDDISVLLALKSITMIFMYINHILLARYTNFYTKGF